MSKRDELKEVVVNAIKDNVMESVDNGLKKLGLCESTRSYFAVIVVQSMEESVLDDMFNRLIESREEEE